MAKRRTPKTLAIRYKSAPAAAKVYAAFRGTTWKHKPRSSDKAAWMRERGYDPELPYASAKAPNTR